MNKEQYKRTNKFNSQRLHVMPLLRSNNSYGTSTCEGLHVTIYILWKDESDGHIIAQYCTAHVVQSPTVMYCYRIFAEVLDGME